MADPGLSSERRITRVQHNSGLSDQLSDCDYGPVALDRPLRLEQGTVRARLPAHGRLHRCSRSSGYWKPTLRICASDRIYRDRECVQLANHAGNFRRRGLSAQRGVLGALRTLVRYIIDELTATLTATRSMISPSTKILTHDSTPDRDQRGPSRTLRMDLRICECRCGAPGWRTSRLGGGDPM